MDCIRTFLLYEYSYWGDRVSDTIMWRLLDKVHMDDFPATITRMCILWGFFGVVVNFFTILHIVNNSEWQIENYIGAIFGVLAIVIFVGYLKLMKERKLF